MDLSEVHHWIFDMDGTLTVAVHDFDAIRAELSLPPGDPILETLDALPAPQAAALYERLDAIELDLARRATAQSGARRLLEQLSAQGVRVGIVTRNSERIALETLEHCKLLGFFDPADVIGRESAAPKPRPDGVLKLLRRWQVPGRHAVMVGDFRFDLEAGRQAGCRTVYLDVGGTGAWSAHADHRVADLDALAAIAPGADARDHGRGPRGGPNG